MVSSEGVADTRMIGISANDARSTAMSVFALMLFIGQSLGAVGLGGAVDMIGYRNTLSVVAIGMAWGTDAGYAIN